MKKYLLVLITIMLLLTGCGKKTNESSLKDFSKLVNNSESYTLEGDLKLLSNNEEYLYDIKVYFKKGDYYKVSLMNKGTDTEQIILKNENGVYIVSTSINKSFKFQSEWPNNSSQSYILETILSDLENDDDREFTSTYDGYEFICDVNYPNNKSLERQKISFNKNNEPTKVIVMNSDGNAVITFNISKINMDAKLDDSIFKLENNVSEDTESTLGNLESVMYPTYLPLNTTFSSQETISGTDSERVILTFTGEKSFVMVEEAKKVPSDMEVISVYGDIAMVDDTLGVLTDTSVMWNRGNTEYYISSSTLTKEELLSVASSTKGSSVSK